MKTFRRAVVVFLIFMIGTVCLIHVDRQGAIMDGRQSTLVQNIENIIEK